MPVRSPRRVVAAVETWFAAFQRPLPWRRTYDPYLVWVSEVMLQQTRMEVVLRYYDRFLERFPDLESLARATDRAVLAAWSGLGYYRRARMLRDGTRWVVENGGRIPDSVGDLVKIPGIGRYTAGAIASIAFNRCAPIVDGNVARILARLTGIDDRAAAWKTSQQLVEASQRPRDFNQGLMDIGALVCKPRNPECSACPLTRHCFAYKNQRTDTLPRSKEKAAARAMNVAIYIIRDRRGRVLMRRESGALMTSMMHLPHGDTSLLSGTPLRVTPGELLSTFRHTITNRRVAFSVFSGHLGDSIRDSDEYEWVDPSKLDEVPHASYVAKALAGSQVPGARYRGPHRKNQAAPAT